jgi:translation initiation factor IF-3
LSLSGKKVGGRKIAKYYRLNQNIASRPLRVVDADGTNLGVIERDAAIERAKEQGLDLVEIAPQANPPVAKIVEFQKFRYEESKKEQAAKKNVKEVELKEIWLTPRIAEHDLQTRLRRVDDFLDDGDRILFRVKFKPREMAHTEFGYQLLRKIFEQFGDRISIEREPRQEGRNITAIIGKAKAAKKEENGNHEENKVKQSLPT